MYICINEHVGGGWHTNEFPDSSPGITFRDHADAKFRREINV